MAKIVRTANGKMIDMDKLRVENEDTIAIGNMKVNARGDKIGAGGKVTKKRNQVMGEHYQTKRVSEQDIERSIDRQKQQGAQVSQGKIKGKK